MAVITINGQPVEPMSMFVLDNPPHLNGDEAKPATDKDTEVAES